MEARTLREELQASMEGPSEEIVIEAQAPAEPAPVEPVAAEPGAEAKLEAGDRPRGPDGKFLAKTDPASTGEGAPQAAASPAPEPISPETAKPEGQEAQAEPIRVPPSLPAAVKAKFGTLDPDVQKAFVALEGTVQEAKAEWGRKGERLNRFDQLVGPRLARWQMAGVDEFQGIQMLLAAQDVLDNDPIKGLVQVARSYGVTPAHLAQAFGLSQASAPQPGQEGQQAPTYAPDWQAALQQHLNPVVQQVQTLQQQLQQSQQAQEAAEINRLTAQVQAFANDPKNLYFNDVSDDVVELIRAAQAAGRELSLPDAYERAIWANPTIRSLLQQSEASAKVAEEARKVAEAKKQAEAQARAKAADAARAAGSVTGSPAPGSQTPGGGSTGNLRKDLEAAFQSHAGV